MPNRILKESICTSDTVDQLSWFEECFFTRLIVNCDDYGRMDARAAILKARLFPLKSVTEKQIDAALNKLSTVGIVIVYEHDDRPYMQLVTWEDHQTVRAKKSKFPAPNESEIICKQMQADASKCPRNPIQSESNPNPNPNARARDGDIFANRSFSLKMQEALTDWLTYKREKRQSYKPTGLTKFLTEVENKLKLHAEADVIALISECMANNWQGIIWDKITVSQRQSFERPTQNLDHLAIDPFADEKG